MTFKDIQNFIRKKDYLFSEHDDEERTKDQLIVQEIEQAILAGKIIEERLNDPRGESRLVAGRSKNDKLIHIVIGVKFDKPVIVTVYTPSQTVWIRGRIRKRRNI
jgi:hypothetical protein